MELFFTEMGRKMRKPLPPEKRYFTLLTLLLIIFSGQLFAQDLTRHNWYFGNSNNGIRFSRSDNSVTLITNKAPLGIGGSAVATDPVNGNLLFYSDGVNVYDITHNPMPNGTGLAGNPAGNQAVAVAKVPGSTSQYYVFTNTASGAAGGTVSYSIVDMSLFGNATFPTPAIGDVATARRR
jgi:hypothetical protein